MYRVPVRPCSSGVRVHIWLILHFFYPRIFTSGLVTKYVGTFFFWNGTWHIGLYICIFFWSVLQRTNLFGLPLNLFCLSIAVSIRVCALSDNNYVIFSRFFFSRKQGNTITGSRSRFGSANGTLWRENTTPAVYEYKIDGVACFDPDSDITTPYGAQLFCPI